MIEIIPNWHPIWVHFAVALLSTAAFLFLIFGWRPPQTNGRTNALIVARWTLRLGVIAAIGALLTGYLASGSVTHDDVSHANMMVHRNWAFAATSIFAIIALIDLMKRNETRISILSFLLLVAGGVTLAKTGLEGAENVYQYGLGVQSLPDISTHEHSGGVEATKHEHADAASDSHENGAEGCEMNACGDTSTHEQEQHDQESTGQLSEESEHGHDQPSADGSKSAIAEDGHNHSHANAPSTVEMESENIEDASHPASLLATQLADAIATGDINTLRSIVAPDVLIFESGGMESSLSEYEGHHMLADMTFMKAVRREVISQQVIDLGDSATVVTRSRVHGIYKDQEIDMNSTETLVMRKVNGQWKAVHIHWSSS